MKDELTHDYTPIALKSPLDFSHREEPLDVSP